MGNVRVEHFAHSKEPCDEVIAYTTGLYSMIYQVLTNAEPLYIPALVVSYTLPYRGVLDENSVKSIAKIAGENYDGNNRINITPGEYAHFDNVERVYSDNKTIQEIIVSVGTDKIAIKIMPPDTVCKIGSVSPHVDLATLVFDFTNESDTIQTSTTESFKKILLSDKVRKYWLYNPRIEDAYSVIIDLSIKAEEERQKREDQYEKERILKEQKEQERRSEMLSKARVVDAEQLHREAQLGYMEVKDKDFTKMDRVLDSFNRRWLKCVVCNEVKLTNEFVPGISGGSHGRCSKCNNQINRRKLFNRTAH